MGLSSSIKTELPQFSSAWLPAVRSGTPADALLASFPCALDEQVCVYPRPPGEGPRRGVAVRRLPVKEPHRLPLQRQFLLFPRHRTGSRQHGGWSDYTVTVVGETYLDAVPYRRSVFNAIFSCYGDA